MKIRFNKQIRLLVRQECYQDLWDAEQEWEFDKGEELDVYDVIYGEPRKFKTGNKPAKLMRFADIFLLEGNEYFPDYIHMVPANCFEIVE